jgi:hypothetical protein
MKFVTYGYKSQLSETINWNYNTHLDFNPLMPGGCKFYILWFLWILEQTAIISSYGINWLAFITEGDGGCLLRGTRCIFIDNQIDFQV